MLNILIHILQTADTVDFTRGVLQTIGFKELYIYLREICRRQEGQPLQIEDKDLERMRNDGVEAMKRATRRYVRYV